METLYLTKFPKYRWAFRSYLWGMETKFIPLLKFNLQIYSDPTYEAWKQILWAIITSNYKIFRSYLWGMETRKSPLWYRGGRYSDPTYEAWKHLFKRPTYPPNSEFRSYLWGMETHLRQLQSYQLTSYSDPTYEAWKRFKAYVINLECY